MNGSKTDPIKRSLPSGLRVPTRVSSSRFRDDVKSEGDEDEDAEDETCSAARSAADTATIRDRSR